MFEKEESYKFNVKLIEDYMKQNNFNVESFAKRCRIDVIDLKAVLANNTKNAPLYTIIRISDVIGVSYIKLFILKKDI